MRRATWVATNRGIESQPERLSQTKQAKKSDTPHDAAYVGVVEPG
jgi:hypothetical protein